MNQLDNHPMKDLATDRLIKVAIETHDEDPKWDLIRLLHLRGTQEVFDQAKELCNSDDPEIKVLGIDIIAQLGVPDRTFPEAGRDLFYTMLETEIDIETLVPIIVALGHTQDEMDHTKLDRVIAYADHEDSDIRFAVVQALSKHNYLPAITALITLSADLDDEIRDWATFALGSMIDGDTPEIRRALWARIEEEDHWDTYSEAITGLALRKDPGIYDVILKELQKDDPTSLIFEASAEFGDPRLLEPMEHILVKAKQEDPPCDPEWIENLESNILFLKEQLKQ